MCAKACGSLVDPDLEKEERRRVINFFTISVLIAANQSRTAKVTWTEFLLCTPLEGNKGETPILRRESGSPLGSGLSGLIFEPG